MVACKFPPSTFVEQISISNRKIVETTAKKKKKIRITRDFFSFPFLVHFRISKNLFNPIPCYRLSSSRLLVKISRGELVFRTDNLASPKSDQTRGSLNFCGYFPLPFLTIFRNLLARKKNMTCMEDLRQRGYRFFYFIENNYKNEKIRKQITSTLNVAS